MTRTGTTRDRAAAGSVWSASCAVRSSSCTCTSALSAFLSNSFKRIPNDSAAARMDFSASCKAVDMWHPCAAIQDVYNVGSLPLKHWSAWNAQLYVHESCVLFDQGPMFRLQQEDEDRQKGIFAVSNLRCSQYESTVQLQQCIAALPFVQCRFSNLLCQQRRSTHKHMLISTALAATGRMMSDH